MNMAGFGITFILCVLTICVQSKESARNWARPRKPYFQKKWLVFAVRGRGNRYTHHEVYV